MSLDTFVKLSYAFDSTIVFLYCALSISCFLLYCCIIVSKRCCLPALILAIIFVLELIGCCFSYLFCISFSNAVLRCSECVIWS